MGIALAREFPQGLLFAAGLAVAALAGVFGFQVLLYFGFAGDGVGPVIQIVVGGDVQARRSACCATCDRTHAQPGCAQQGVAQVLRHALPLQGFVQMRDEGLAGKGAGRRRQATAQACGKGLRGPCLRPRCFAGFGLG